ncbi:MAG: 8-oxoguanine deaminase, partial [bacterium]|nr:8-oxoguanine deaminase [bacterium]
MLLKNISHLYSAGKVIKDVDILIEGCTIKKIGKNINAKTKVINCKDRVVTPGFINTHHHLFQTFTRTVPHVQKAKLFDWLKFLYKIWKNVNPEWVYYSALEGFKELLLSGCTTTTDHFYIFPKNAPKDLLDYTIKAALDIGIRFHPTRGSMSKGVSKGGLPPDEVVQDEDEIMEDVERVVKRYNSNSKYSMIRVGIAPCSPFSVSKDLMKMSAEYAKKNDLLLHTHLAETLDEEKYCLEVYKMRPLEFMEEVGWLTKNSWFAHSIYLADEEIKKLAKYGCGVAHCPTSNLRLGSGVFPLRKFLNYKVKVGLGVDGSASNDSSNMLLEGKFALYIHRLNSPMETDYKLILNLMTIGGASVLNRDDIGELKEGKAADLTIWKINEAGVWDQVAALLFLEPRKPEYVIINGEVIVKNGFFTKVSESEFEKAKKVF